MKVTIAQPSNSLGFSPVLVAQQKGYFQDEGIQADVVLAGSGSKAAAAVIGGSAQVGSSALGDVLGAVQQGQDIKTFAGMVLGVDGDLVIKKSVAQKLGISDSTPLDQRVKALKGLKLAISTPGSGTDTELRFVLSQNGLKPEQDVQILTTGSVENSQATYAKGAADGASLSSPNAQEALLNNDGFAAVDYTQVPDFKTQQSIGLWATSKWLDANSDTAARVTAAIWKALDYIQKNPKDAGEVVRKGAWAQLDQNVFDLAWSSETKLLTPTPEVKPDGLKSLIDFVA
ncbi:MAG TPA: ABC transporter substrate-binding protein, partial [Chloroflexota bacterium]|nr:ABC transporter substrate-binding protein [Chloroflexota bacterium]